MGKKMINESGEYAGRVCTTQADIDRAVVEGVRRLHLLNIAGAGAKLIVRGDVEVTVYGATEVQAYDRAKVSTGGTPVIVAYDSVHVDAAEGSVYAHDDVTVEASGEVYVTSTGNSKVRAHDAVHVRTNDAARVELADDTESSSSVVLDDSLPAR